MRVVIDTNIFVGACLDDGAANKVIRACLERKIHPIIGNALLSEIEDVICREAIFKRSRLNKDERNELFDIFLSTCEWVRIYFLWRPNLKDEADNHLIELAVNGGANFVITRNLKDFKHFELKFPELTVISPEMFLKDFAWEH